MIRVLVLTEHSALIVLSCTGMGCRDWESRGSAGWKVKLRGSGWDGNKYCRTLAGMGKILRYYHGNVALIGFLGVRQVIKGESSSNFFHHS